MFNSSARAGIPLGSTEIGNLGISSIATVPTPSISPIFGTQSMVAPAVPVVTSPVAASPMVAAGVLPSTTISPIQALVPGLSGSTPVR
jgi:hypothetical protein